MLIIIYTCTASIQTLETIRGKLLLVVGDYTNSIPFFLRNEYYFSEVYRSVN